MRSAAIPKSTPGKITDIHWEFVRLDQFSRPSGPARETLSNRVRGLLEHLRLNPAGGGYFREKVNLTSVPPYLMERVAPNPGWQFLVPALTEALGDWLENTGVQSPIRFVVNPPFSGVSEALTLWAKERKWRLVEGPPFRKILNGYKDWVEQFKHNSNMPLVIPRFEDLFLRHHAGLMLPRQMLNWLWQREHPCLIGIDSWAYTYLNKVLQLDALKSQPITLAACKYAHLGQWFHNLASGAERFGIVFRQIDTGIPVLRPGNAHARPGDGDNSHFMKYLAVYSRGNPGVAWTLWRHSLQYEIDDSVVVKAKNIAEGDRGRTMWVKTWAQMDLPAIPVNPMDLYVLHSLLLHGGLCFGALTQTLALYDVSEIMASIHRLSGNGLIEECDETWKVTSLGYPAVREAMVLNGFLVDGF